jgi:hypothetical protein
MAVYRETPTCHKCGKKYKAICKDDSNLPTQLQMVGDNFIKWDIEGHKCNKNTKKYKEYLEHQKKEFYDMKMGKLRQKWVDDLNKAIGK